MIAYKFLRRGISPFTGTPWPSPTAGRPGGWMEAEGRLGLCTNGIHACRPSQLPPWMGGELWAVELDGEIVQTPPALIARRGRLIRRVEGWDAGVQAAFAADCARRAARVAGDDTVLGEIVSFIDRLAEAGRAGPAGYWAAVVAGQAASGDRQGETYDQAFGQERAVQVRWMVGRLALEEA